MEEIRVSAAQLKEKLKELIHEGNVRRIKLRNGEGRVLLDAPLTAGIAGMVLAPFWITVGTIAAMVSDITIVVERDGV